MNIVVICHYFWPEPCAPAARLKEMSEVWDKLGHNVTVVTNFPNHPTGLIQEGYTGKKFIEEYLGNIKIYRCSTYATPNKGIIKKNLAHLLFAFNSVRQTGTFLKGTDVIVISSPPLFTGFAAYYLSKKLKCPFIIEVRDLWPAIFVELGILKNKILIKILEYMELFLYSKSAKVVALTKSFANDIANRGIEKRKLEVIPNGVDIGLFASSIEKSDGLLNSLGLIGKFIVLYLGTHGISQNLFTIIDSAYNLREHDDIVFLFVGDGADKEKLIKKAQNMKLQNIIFIDSQPKDKVKEYYSIADVCLVPLKDIPLFETFIPSKMFEIMGSGKPLIASVKGESADILNSSDGGAIVCQPDNALAIAENILKLKNDNTLRKEVAEKGRKFVEENYRRDILAKRYLKIIHEVVER